MDHISIQNFRCIENATFAVSPFTVFVGANGSGKTSILAAFSAPLVAEPRNAGDPKRTSTVKWRHGSDEILRRRKEQQVVGTGVPPSVAFLQLTLSALRSENETTSVGMLAADGSNLPNLLGSIGRVELGRLAEQFCMLVPIFRDVDVRPSSSPGKSRIVFQDRWNDSRWYNQTEVSDGSLIMLALLAAFAQPQKPDILAIDEIERGLHPYLLQRVVELCRALSKGELGRPVQVLAATHSPHLLDFLDPSEVRFVTRDRNSGNTVVTAPPTHAPEWARAAEAYRESLGDLWLSGALGGVVGR